MCLSVQLVSDTQLCAWCDTVGKYDLDPTLHIDWIGNTNFNVEKVNFGLPGIL